MSSWRLRAHCYTKCKDVHIDLCGYYQYLNFIKKLTSLVAKNLQVKNPKTFETSNNRILEDSISMFNMQAEESIKGLKSSG